MEIRQGGTKEMKGRRGNAELLDKGRHAATATPALMAGESMLDEPYYVAKAVFDSRATHNKMSKHGVEVRKAARGVTVQTSGRNRPKHSGAAQTHQQMCSTVLTTSCLIVAPGSNVLVPFPRWMFRAQSKGKHRPLKTKRGF